MIKLLFATLLIALGAEAQDIQILTTSTPTHICYRDSRGDVCEKFNAPNVKFNGEQKYIIESPIDPARNLDNIPTYGLAAFHHWIFGITTIRAQIDTAKCMGAVAVLQQILSSRLTNETREVNKKYEAALPFLNAVIDYQIPMNAVTINNPSRLATKKEAIAHARAGIGSTNIGVYWHGFCEDYRNYYLTKIKR